MGKREKPIYTFEDWKKGYHSQPSIPSMSYCIPPEELEKIHKEQERLFWERVEEMTERYKAEYQGKANSSLDLANLNRGEIEFIEDLFYNKYFRTPVSNTEGAILANGNQVIWGIGQITGIRLRQVREIYKKWVIDGKRDCTYVRYNNQSNTFNDVPVAVVALKNYFDWLKGEPTIIENNLPTQGKLKVKQIALIHVYNGKTIIRENADSIASEYGYNSKKSGEGLFQDYTLYASTANRKAIPDPFSKKKLRNKIELFESINQYLTDAGKIRAKDEIQILKNYLDKE